MKCRYKLLTGALLAGLLAAHSLWATTIGTSFTYQGRLTVAGSRANGLYDFTFKLYDQLEGGIQIGATVTQYGIEVVSGLFTVNLDFGAAVFMGDARWLEISVRAGGVGDHTILSPRQQLSAAPYAVHSSTSDWAGLIGVPAGLADNTDNDLLSQLICATDQVLKWSSSSWVCADIGDITAVNVESGSGLTGGAGIGEVTLGIDPGALQRRVSGVCAMGESIHQINQDGTVICGSASSSAIVADTGWLPAPMHTKLILDLETSSYDFLIGMSRIHHYQGGRMIIPSMASINESFKPAYVSIDGASLAMVGCSYLGEINNLGDRTNMILHAGDVRITAFQRPPDFDTGWSPCQANVTYVFSHNIGVLPHLAVVEIAENSDGSGWRVPTMSSANERYVDGPWFPDKSWRQTAIVVMDESTVSLRTHGSLAYFCNTAGGSAVAPASGYCRIKLFYWTPDYDSDWTAISTAAGDRDKWFQHGFGVIPSLVMLWVAENSDGSGWILPAMSAYHSNYSHGVGIYALTEEWVVVKGGSASVARFVDENGYGKQPTSGFVRLLAWR
jgi:hypothetical protein